MNNNQDVQKLIVKRCYKCDRQTIFLKNGLCLSCRELNKLARMISK